MSDGLPPWVAQLKVKEAKAILTAVSVDPAQYIEKRTLLKAVADNVKSEEEAKDLMSQARSAADKASEKSKKNTKGFSAEAIKKAQETLAGMLLLPLQSMEYQGKVMLRDPAYVRRNNKSLEAASNEEIRKTAEQMLAKAKLIKKDPKKAAAEMDRQTIENLTNWIQTNHGEFKKWLRRIKGLEKLSDSMLDQQLAMVSSMDRKTLHGCLSFLCWGYRNVMQPLGGVYIRANRYTFGLMRYIVLILMAVLAYYFAKLVWFIGAWFLRKTGMSSSSEDPDSFSESDYSDYAAPPASEEPVVDAPSQAPEQESSAAAAEVPLGSGGDEQDEWEF